MWKRITNLRTSTWIWLACLALLMGLGVRSLWWSDYAECIRGWGVWLDSNNGALSLGLMRDANAESFLYSAQGANRVWTWLPSLIKYETPGQARWMYELTIPYWLLIAGVTGLWALTRWWRARRSRQA